MDCQLAQTSQWGRKVTNTMAYIGLNDREKLMFSERLVADLTTEEAVAVCVYCGRKDRMDTMSNLNSESCLDCGSVCASVQTPNAVDWVADWQLHVNPISKRVYRSYDAIIETPFDAWLDTSHNTITVKLERGYRTFPIPCKSTWVFDIEAYIKRLIESRRRKSTNRKGAVTAA